MLGYKGFNPSGFNNSLISSSPTQLGSGQMVVLIVLRQSSDVLLISWESWTFPKKFRSFFGYKGYGRLPRGHLTSFIYRVHTTLSKNWNSISLYRVIPPFSCDSFIFLIFLQRRSEVITTYALCGFTNFLGLGVLLGGLGPMARSREGDMARIAIRTLFAATIACFMTASIAGKP